MSNQSPIEINGGADGSPAVIHININWKCSCSCGNRQKQPQATIVINQTCEKPVSFTTSNDAENKVTMTGTPLRFQPTTSTDSISKDGLRMVNIMTRNQNITFMKEYENKSVDELRFEDYLASRNRPSGFQTFSRPSNTGGLSSVDKQVPMPSRTFRKAVRSFNSPIFPDVDCATFVPPKSYSHEPWKYPCLPAKVVKNFQCSFPPEKNSVLAPLNSSARGFVWPPQSNNECSTNSSWPPQKGDSFSQTNNTVRDEMSNPPQNGGPSSQANNLSSSGFRWPPQNGGSLSQTNNSSGAFIWPNQNGGPFTQGNSLSTSAFRWPPQNGGTSTHPNNFSTGGFHWPPQNGGPFFQANNPLTGGFRCTQQNGGSAPQPTNSTAGGFCWPPLNEGPVTQAPVFKTGTFHSPPQNGGLFDQASNLCGPIWPHQNGSGFCQGTNESSSSPESKFPSEDPKSTNEISSRCKMCGSKKKSVSFFSTPVKLRDPSREDFANNRPSGGGLLFGSASSTNSTDIGGSSMHNHHQEANGPSGPFQNANDQSTSSNFVRSNHFSPFFFASTSGNSVWGRGSNEGPKPTGFGSTNPGTPFGQSQQTFGCFGPVFAPPTFGSTAFPASPSFGSSVFSSGASGFSSSANDSSVPSVAPTFGNFSRGESRQSTRPAASAVSKSVSDRKKASRGEKTTVEIAAKSKFNSSIEKPNSVVPSQVKDTVVVYNKPPVTTRTVGLDPLFIYVPRRTCQYQLTEPMAEKARSVEKSAIVIQRFWRAASAAKKCRKEFLRKKAATVTLQKVWRERKKAKVQMERSEESISALRCLGEEVSKMEQLAIASPANFQKEEDEKPKPHVIMEEVSDFGRM